MKMTGYLQGFSKAAMKLLTDKRRVEVSGNEETEYDR